MQEAALRQAEETLNIKSNTLINPLAEQQQDLERGLGGEEGWWSGPLTDDGLPERENLKGVGAGMVGGSEDHIAGIKQPSLLPRNVKWSFFVCLSRLVGR